MQFSALLLAIFLVCATGLQFVATSETIAFVTIEPTIKVDPTSGKIGTLVTVVGTDFANPTGGGDRIIISFDGALIAEAEANETGNFEVTFQIPWDASPGETTVQATGDESRLFAEATFEVLPLEPTIKVNPISGRAGTEVTVTGTDFANPTGDGDVIHIHFDGSEVTTTVADETGNFKVTFQIPSDTRPGYKTVQATGEKSGLVDRVLFEVLTVIELTPDDGPAGTEVELEGFGFGKKEKVRISSDVDKLKDFEITADENGNFKVTFQIPRNSSPGEATVQATGLESGLVRWDFFEITPTNRKPEFNCQGVCWEPGENGEWFIKVTLRAKEDGEIRKVKIQVSYKYEKEKRNGKSKIRKSHATGFFKYFKRPKQVKKGKDYDWQWEWPDDFYNRANLPDPEDIVECEVTVIVGNQNIGTVSPPPPSLPPPD
jgi:hypothetical protein